MYCRHCGAELPDGSKFCVSCGQPQAIEALTILCPSCGGQIPPNADTCPSCGALVPKATSEPTNASTTVVSTAAPTPVAAPAPVQPTIVINNITSNTNTNTNTNTNRNTNVNTVHVHAGKLCRKWTAFWLCLLLGVVGAHKFYEGKTGMGILYIFTCGLFGIGWIIDLFTILAKPDPYYV